MAKRILIAVIFVPLLIGLMLFAPPPLWAAVVAFISGLASYELLRAAGEGRVTAPMKAAAVVSAAVIPVARLCAFADLAAWLCAFLVAAVSFWCAIRAYDEGEAGIGFAQVLLNIFAGAVMPLALSSLVTLKGMDHGRYLVMLAVILAFITDGGAYFAGVFLGRHRGITKVSPNKSVEGYLGGFLTGVVFSLLYGLVVSRAGGVSANYLSLALCGLFGALATELGDLSFSFVKRQYGVKDFGHLLPGHGGMLDRFDSMFFCGPVVLFIVTLLPAFTGAA